MVEHLWTFSGEGDYNGGIGRATSMRFLPGGQLLVAHRKGQVTMLDTMGDPIATPPVPPSSVEDLMARDRADRFVYEFDWEVYSGDDHGLMSIELHPDFATNGEFYLLYTGQPKNVAELPNNAAITPIRPSGEPGAFYPHTNEQIPQWGSLEGGGFSWRDQCFPLQEDDGTGDNGIGLYCEHPYYVDRLKLDMATGKATKLNTLVNAACGASSTHGPGDMKLIPSADGIPGHMDLIFSLGDGALYEQIDLGNPGLDGCYDPSIGGIQGSYRSQRDDFSTGKVLRIPYALLSSDQRLDPMTLDKPIKGLRNPFRMHYQNDDDTLYIGDVGFGDAGTSERIYIHEGISQADKHSNFGWPCIEGIHQFAFEEPGWVYAWDGQREQEQMGRLNDVNDPLCLPVGKAALDYVCAIAEENGNDCAVEDDYGKDGGVAKPYIHDMIPDDTVPDDTWAPPVFEYRLNEKGGGVTDKIDNSPEYAAYCNGDFAAITGLTIYPPNAQGIPTEYRDKLIFSDFIKRCIWYFDSRVPAGEHPHLFVADVGAVDFQVRS